MALIAMPDSMVARVVSNEYHLDYSGRQIVIGPSIWSNRRTFIHPPSYPEWVGVMQIGPLSAAADGRDDMDEMNAMHGDRMAMQIRSWLSAFNGMANTSMLPLYAPTMEGSTSIGSPSDRGDTVQHTIGSAAGIEVGHMVSAGGKVYIVREVASNSIVLDPQRPISSGTLRAVTHIEARLRTPEHPDMPWTADFWGPWALQWVEG